MYIHKEFEMSNTKLRVYRYEHRLSNVKKILVFIHRLLENYSEIEFYKIN